MARYIGIGMRTEKSFTEKDLQKLKERLKVAITKNVQKGEPITAMWKSIDKEFEKIGVKK